MAQQIQNSQKKRIRQHQTFSRHAALVCASGGIARAPSQQQYGRSHVEDLQFPLVGPTMHSLEDRQHGHSYSTSKYQPVDAAASQSLRCFHVRLQQPQPLEPAKTFKTKQHCRGDTLGGLPQVAVQQGAVTCHRRAEPREGFRDNKLQAPSHSRTGSTSQMQPGRYGYGYWPTAVEARPAPRAPAMATSLAAAKAVTATAGKPPASATFLHGTSRRADNHAGVRTCLAAPLGGLHEAKNAQGNTTRVAPHYWSPPVLTNKTAASAPSGAGGMSSPAAAAGQHSALAGVCARTQLSTRTPGAAAAAVGAATALNKKPSVTSGASMVTRRQSAAAELREVVRIDDSSDEDYASPSSTQVAPITSAHAMTEGPGLAAGRNRLALKDFGKSQEKPQSYEPPAAYVVFVAALVNEDGRCCLLSTDAVCTAAELSGSLEQQQKSSHCGEAGAAANPAKVESVNDDLRAHERLLVLQAYQDERGISLDLWKPRLLRETHDDKLPSDSAGIPVTPAAPPHDEELSNILSFPQKSICHMRCLSLRAQNPQWARSRSNSSKAICHRCGRGRSRSKVRIHKDEPPGRPDKHHEAPIVDKERKDSAAAELSAKTSRHTDGELHRNQKGKKSVASSSGSTSDALKGQSVSALPPMAPTVASDKQTTRKSSAHKAKKSCTEPAHKRQASARSESSHRLPSEGRKEGAEARGTSEGEARHSRSHSKKSCSSQHSGKGAHAKESGRDSSKRKSHSTRAKGCSNESTSTGAVNADSEQQGHKNAAPINALAVVSGKSPGESLQLKPDKAAEVEAPLRSNGEDSTSCRKGNSSVEVKSSIMHPASNAEGSSAEPQQITHQDLHNISSQKETKKAKPREQSTTRSTSRTHQSSEKAGCCSSCHKSRSGSLRSDTACPTVSVLCLKLQQSEAGGLQCSKLVQSMLERDYGRSSADTLSKQSQQTKEGSQLSGLEAFSSSSLNVSDDMAKQIRQEKGINPENNCKGSEKSHRSRRRSRERERPHDPARRHRSESSKSGSQKTHSSRKHHRSDGDRKQTKSDGSASRKKRRREASACSHGEAVASKGETELDSQGQSRSDSVNTSCRRVPASASSNPSSKTEVPEECSGAVLPVCGVGETESSLCKSTTDDEQQNGADYLYGDFCASGPIKGYFLMLCVGPQLHDVGLGGNTTAGDNGLDASHSPNCSLQPVSVLASVAPCDSSTGSGGQKKSATAHSTCSSQELSSLCGALTVPLGDRGKQLKKPEELVHVATLAQCIARLTAEQRGKARPACSSAQNSHQTNEAFIRLTNMLERFVREGYELGESLRSSGSLKCNLPLESLLRSWKSRVFGSSKFALAAAAAVQEPAGSSSVASTGSAAAPSSENESAMAATAARAAAASPPVFDLLLDDRTLRRLSGKEFLDDTIIDFCLGFIVDHILTPEERLRVHISNTFFLSALMAQICEVEGHSRLTRWLKKELTPLPRKDFIFIPVHHKDQHWSLAVVVYPWRALNCISEKADNSLKQPSKAERSDQALNESRLTNSLMSRPPLAAHYTERDAGKAQCYATSAAKRRGGLEAGGANGSGSLPCRGPHAHRGSQPRARMFHVDSMGLRSVFDRCRGRLKRFLMREFEYRCEGKLKSGERAELCTESCCWQDGLSCTLHTPRQQNGYDCGVFVVEYVHFLTRNLNAIELLLSGPTRDVQPYERGFTSLSSSSPSGSFARHPALHGRSIKSEVHSENDAHRGRLESVLGFSCPCMAVGVAVDPNAQNTYSSSLPSDLKLRLNKVKGTNVTNMGTVSADRLQQQQHLQPKPCHPTNALTQRGSVSLQKVEPVHPSLMPYASIAAEEKCARTEAPSQSCSVPTRLQLHGAKTPAEAASSEASVAAGIKTEPARHSSHPPWGPLPYSFCKRRSAHTKWFSQDRVTQRRSQLLKMLLFMRENALWREDPKLIAHLKSLFLGVEGS
ncbi:hypothetical protein Emed_001016 [Eimeria media]